MGIPSKSLRPRSRSRVKLGSGPPSWRYSRSPGAPAPRKRLARVPDWPSARIRQDTSAHEGEPRPTGLLGTGRRGRHRGRRLGPRPGRCSLNTHTALPDSTRKPSRFREAPTRPPEELCNASRMQTHTHPHTHTHTSSPLKRKNKENKSKLPLSPDKRSSVCLCSAPHRLFPYKTYLFKGRKTNPISTIILREVYRDTSDKVVWIVDHSYVKWAKRRAEVTWEPNLGLKNTKVQWLGKGGMRWSQLLDAFFSTGARPDVLILHAGGNDLGLLRIVDLLSAIKEDVLAL
ncbi:uncharacterized protein LOC128616152 [Ictalurus furcatus]|uniref:uncharacterized protein LOC128616152 n=1 Tax=Ictalurus furcatus TaxID=66913 RepID=UPI0023503E3F|nr:uncharacterized protein LOC128616152 [Ictalurus furcatus]